jgi:hypoxia up-regulated 1
MLLTTHRLAAFDSSDKSRRVREEVLNSLEAFTYRGRDYLEDESFIGASIAAIRTTLEEKLSAASDWIYSEGAEAGEKELKAKLKELEDIVNPVLKRKTEAIKRPDAVKELKDTIAHIKEVAQLVDGQIKTQIQESSKSSEAVAAKASATPSPSAPKDELDELEEEDVSSSAKPAEPEITEVPTIYTEDDLKKVQETVESSQKWLDENEAKQAKLGPTDDPAFTVKDLQAEKKRIDDVVMDMMMKKMRHFKPPGGQQKPKPSTKPKPKKSKKATKKDAKKDAGEGPTDEELQEALKKAGVDSDKIKLKNFGHKDEMEDEQGRKLKKLKIDENASEEDIRKAIEDLTNGAKEEEKHDEL